MVSVSAVAFSFTARKEQVSPVSHLIHRLKHTKCLIVKGIRGMELDCAMHVTCLCSLQTQIAMACCRK